MTEVLESLQELVCPAQQEQGDDEGDEGQAGHHSGPHQDANTPDLMLRADPVMTHSHWRSTPLISLPVDPAGEPLLVLARVLVPPP